MKQLPISVIVPVYNVEPWLAPCVDSVLAQSFGEFELILVDDGSPDSCGAICDDYAKKDGRVKVIHQKNGGLSAARNTGIAAAAGRYIAFIDSDDFIHPDYLKNLYDACQTTGADMAVCAFESIAESGDSLPTPVFTRPTEAGVFGGKQLLEQFGQDNSIAYTVAWNKLYKAELWQNLRYPVGMIHEDDAVAPTLYWNCAKVVCLAQPLLYYRLREGSIVRSGLKPNSFDAVVARAGWCHFFIEHKLPKPVLDKILAACWRRYLWCCAKAQQAPLTWPLAARWQAAQCEMQQLLPATKQCRALSLREKLSCLRWAKKALPLPPKTDKQRVALLLPGDLPVPAVRGGAVEGLATHLLMQNQEQQALELAVYCRWDAQAAKAAARWPNTLFYFASEPTGRSLAHSLRYHAGRLFGRPVHWNRWYAQPLAFLKRLDAHFYIAEGGDLTGWQQASRQLGRDKFVAHLHGVTTGNKALNHICSKAIAISGYVKDIWCSGLDKSEPAVALVPNCVDGALFCPTPAAPTETADLRAKLGLLPEDFVVLFCGRTCPEKGIHKLVQAMRNIEDASVKLVVVGSPFFAAQAESEFLKELQMQAARLKNRIVFTGFLPNAELPAYYRCADVACFPALWQEPAGITAIEAMACGCPVIATVSGGMPEYLTGSDAVLLPRSEGCENGLCTPIDGVTDLAVSLAKAITTLKNEPARRAAMSAAGQAVAPRFFAPAYYQNTLAALAAWKDEPPCP